MGHYLLGGLLCMATAAVPLGKFSYEWPVVVLAMTTNERMNQARYKHFHTGRRGVMRSPFDRGAWQNFVDLTGWRLGGLFRPSPVEWTKQFEIGNVGEEEKLLESYQYV